MANLFGFQVNELKETSSMNIRATVLCENTVATFNGVLAEAGWAVYLETDQGNYLFDTGQGETVIHNAKILRKNLSEIKGIILSHHHFDHTGGLLDVLNMTGETDVYGHHQLFKKSYWTEYKINGHPKYIGVPFQEELLISKGAKFKFNYEITEIAPDMYLTGEVPRKSNYEKLDKSQVIPFGDEYIPDSLVDDQSLIIKTEAGLVIILGCAHSGLINILNHAIEMTGEHCIYAVFGGTHLAAASQGQLENTIAALKCFDIKKIGVSHCTGFHPSKLIAQEFKKQFFTCNVGTVIEV